MPPHTWVWLGETVSDTTHRMYYRGEEIKEAYYRGEKIWGVDENGDDVRFIDWDGTVLYEMSAEAFLRLSEWPADIHPSKDTDEDKEWGLHARLLDDGWNWDFAAAQSFVRQYRYLDIGAEYATENDAVVVRVSIPTDGKTQSIYFKGVSGAVMDVDWGDGAVSSSVGNGMGGVTHSYSAGNYVITVTPQEPNTTAIYGGLKAIKVYTMRSYICTLEGLYGANATMNARSVYYGKSAEISFGFCYSLDIEYVGFAKEVAVDYCAACLWNAISFAGTLIIPRITTSFARNTNFYSMAGAANVYWNGGNALTNSPFLKGIIYPDTWVGPGDTIYYAPRVERYIIPPLCTVDKTLVRFNTLYLKKVVLPSGCLENPSPTVSMPSVKPANEETRIYVDQPSEDYWKVQIGANTDWYQRIEIIKPVK